MNERWIFSDAKKVKEKKTERDEHLEIQFLPNCIFKYEGDHSNRWDSHATGAYYHQKQSDEIIVYVEHGGFDWLWQQAGKEIPELYYSQAYSNYKLYFIITERTDSTVTVIEYINSYQEDVPESSDFYYTSAI